MSYPIKITQDTPDTGLFYASVTDEGTGKPIPNARVQIIDNDNPEFIIDELVTDSSGITDTIELPAPPVEYSLTPDAERPYSVYNIRIIAPDFETVGISGAEILSGETALQNVTMTPKTEEAETTEELFVIPPHTLYMEYPPKIAESEIKDIRQTGQVVLSRVVIPAGV